MLARRGLSGDAEPQFRDLWNLMRKFYRLTGTSSELLNWRHSSACSRCGFKSKALSRIPNLAPHDARRTCAKLCRAAGGELEQIQLLLGHASVQTTERYLGTKQDLVHAPNDAIKLRLAI
jgi:integrase